jgi:hypothetical protein
MNVETLLEYLPPYQGSEKVIAQQQDVSDIEKEVLAAHQLFSSDYDCIAGFFEGGTNYDICKRLFDFCKNNLPYEAESEHVQSTRSPGGILSLAAIGGTCDCKHFAGFTAGILDALNRLGYNFDWSYRFASYSRNSDAPGHVFVNVNEDRIGEIWIDPAPLENRNHEFLPRYFNDRLATPYFFTDKIPDMALVRMSGGFTGETVFTRNQVQQQPKCGCGCGDGMGSLLTDIFGGNYPPAPPPTDFTSDNPLTQNIDQLFRKFIYDNSSCVVDVFAAGVQYLVDGQPLVFPSPNNGTIPVPQTLQVIYPTVFNGQPVPDGLPRPIVVGNRLVLLPKRDLSILTANNNLWLCFLTSVFAPLVISYSVGDPYTVWLKRRLSSSGAADTNLAHAIYFDMDMADVVDYITNMPTKVPITAAKPEGVRYIGLGGVDIVIPPRRDYATIEQYQNTPPPPLPPFAVKYPDTYLGQPIPPGMPKPVFLDGQIQLAPKGFDWNVLKADNFFWLSFLTSVMYQLVEGFSQFPYGDNGNQLADRILYDQDESDPIADYLQPPENKTFVGKVFEAIGSVVQDVAHFVIRFVGAIPRTAFIGLVRLNVHNFAGALYNQIQTPEGLDKFKSKWYDLGGDWGDIHDAILDGHTKSAILGVRIGVAGVDDAAALLAAAAPVIALLAAFLKANNPAAAGAVDSAVSAMNAMLTAAGYDPIALGSMTGGKPVLITDPVTGKQYSITPPPANSTTNNFFNQIKAHPVASTLVAGGVAFAGYALLKKKKKSA